MSQYTSVIVQTIAVYLLLVVSLRLSGRRELTQLSVLDLVFILLISNALQYKNLEKAQITQSELEAAAREHGIDSIEKVDLAVLETDGNVSIMSREFTHQSSHKRRRNKSLLRRP